MKAFFNAKLKQSSLVSLDGAFIVEDKLTEAEARPELLGTAGCPAAADCVAYCPVQRLLAVATPSGKIKILGKSGVDVTLQARSTSGTASLAFVPYAGALLWLTKSGAAHLVSLESLDTTGSLTAPGDRFTSAAPFEGGQPYAALGCASGAVRVAMLFNGRQSPLEGAEAAAGVRLAPYMVLASQLLASSPISALAVGSTSDGARHLLLAAEQAGTLRVWDFRGERLLCVATPTNTPVLSEAGPALCVCWAGKDRRTFATGHKNGVVLYWGIPAAAAAGPVLAPVLLMHGSCSAEGQAAEPVQSVAYVPPLGAKKQQEGGGGGGGDAGELLAFGGQGHEEPQLLTLFSLAEAQAMDDGPLHVPAGSGSAAPRVSAARQLHWFGPIQGHALVPAAPRGDAPPAVAVLTEGGQLMVHDLAELVPHPLDNPLTAYGPATAAVWSAAHAGASCNQHSLTATALRAAAAATTAASGGSGGSGSVPWAHVLAGGERPPEPPSGGGGGALPLFVTGHRDGRVAIWDAGGEGLLPLAAVEPPSGGASRQAAVAQLALCAAAGMLAVGRQSGAVDLYQFCPRPRTVACHAFEPASSSAATAQPSVSVTEQPAGFQHVLRACVPVGQHPVTALSLAPRHRLLAVGDAGGCVTFVDLARPAAGRALAAGVGPVARLALTYAMAPPPGERPPPSGRRRSVDTSRATGPDSGGGGVPRLCLLVAGRDSSLTVVDAERREPLGKPLRPKTCSEATLWATPLDLEAKPIGPVHKHATLPWTIPPHVLTRPPSPQQGDGGSEEVASPREHGGEDGATAVAAAGASPPPLPAAPMQRALSEPLGPRGGGSNDAANLPMSASLGSAPASAPVVATAAARQPSGESASAPDTPMATSGYVTNPFESQQQDADAVAGGGGGSGANPFEASGSMTSVAAGSSPGLEEAQVRSASLPQEAMTSGLAAASVSNPGAGPASMLREATSGLAAASVSDSGPVPEGTTDLGSAGGEGSCSEPPSRSLSRQGSAGGSGLPPLPEGGPLRHSTKKDNDRVASLQAFYGTNGAAGSSADAPSPTCPDAAAGSGGGLSPSPYVAANLEDLDDADESPAMAAHVLAVTCQFMRLYSFDHVRTGDRSAIAKVTFDEPVVAASSFSSDLGPGIACLTSRGGLIIYSLPALVQMYRCSLDDVVQAPWAGSSDHSWLQGLAATAAVSPEGQLGVFGPFGEFARVALVQGMPIPSEGTRLIDWDLEKAARASLQAMAAFARQQQLQQQLQQQAPPQEPQRLGSPQLEASGSLGKLGGAGKKAGLTGFLSSVVNKVAEAGQEVADTIGKGVNQVGTAIASGRDGAGGLGVSAKEPPKLEDVFSRQVVPAAGAPAAGAAAPGLPAARLSGSSGVAGGGPGSGQPPRAASEAADRSALLGGASSSGGYGGLAATGSSGLATAGSSGGVGPSGGSGSSGVDMERVAQASRAIGSDGRARARTAEEIRAAYGIKQKKADTLQGVMAENADLLAQRGEKLRQMQDRTAMMQNDAMDFAEAAKKLSQQETNKKWWQL